MPIPRRARTPGIGCRPPWGADKMIGSIPAQRVRNFCASTCFCAQSGAAKKVIESRSMDRARVSFREQFILRKFGCQKPFHPYQYQRALSLEIGQFLSQVVEKLRWKGLSL